MQVRTQEVNVAGVVGRLTAVDVRDVALVCRTLTKPLYSGGNTLHITALNAYNALKEHDWTRVLLYHNMGVCEASVAAALLWVGAVYSKEPIVCRWMVTTPVDSWAEILGELSDWSRNTHRWLPYTHADAAIWLRRVKTLAGKNLLEADWEEQEEIVSGTLSPGTMRVCGGNRDDFNSLVLEELEMIAHELSIAEKQKTRPQTYAVWWKTRLRWVASGSSSERAKVDVKESGRDRANKKAVADALKWCDIMPTLQFRRKNSYRCSTKHELGFKNRPLLAQDDFSYLIAAHSSNGIETNVKIGGVVCRQTPYDTAEWIREVNRLGSARTPILCADYSAFDRQHDPVFRAFLNCKIAQNRINQHSLSDDPGWIHMALSAMRVGWGHLNSVVKWPEHSKRMTRGLGSGDRDTARDNGLLHLAYHRVILRLLKAVRPESEVRFFRACGDDEVAVFSSAEAAKDYVRVAAAVGFALNPVKQLLSDHVAEFLQINTTQHNVAVQPLASCVAGAAYGNWYKPSITWYESALQSIVDQCTNIWRRGVPQAVAAYICRKMLDARYRVYEGGQLRDLEWREYYNSDYKGNLFVLDGGHRPAPKIPKYVPERVQLEAKNDGVDDLVGVHADAIKHLGHGAMSALSEMVARDARVSLFKLKGAEHSREWVSRNWPDRVNARKAKLRPMPRKPTMAEFCNMTARRRDRLLVSLKEAAARAGLPPELVGMYTIEELLDNGRPDAYANFEWPEESVRTPLPTNTLWLPAQLAAAY